MLKERRGSQEKMLLRVLKVCREMRGRKVLSGIQEHKVLLETLGFKELQV